MILLDTHVWWWAVNEPKKLSKRALGLIKKTQPDRRAIASISIWEFVMMVKLGRIKLKMSLEEWLNHAIIKTGMAVLELSPRIAIESCYLPGEFHKDPADRIIVATGRVNQMKLLTKDKKILDYPYVESIW